MIEQEKQMHELWSTHPFVNQKLKTLSGQLLRILDPGKLNTDSGPDFFDARIEIDGQLWIGNVEMHLCASDWTKHGHSQDKAYSNVILHVVLENDEDIKDVHGKSIPVLIISPATQTARKINSLVPVYSPGALEIFGAARIANKCRIYASELKSLNGDFETLFQRHLFRRFGMRTNSEPFQQLAHVLPHNVIRRHRSSLADLEALLFGQAGLLPDIPTDGYSAELLFRYRHLANKFSLQPMASQAWKFMRMRPVNFPTIRISQLSALLHQHDHLYSTMITESSVSQLLKILNVKASPYWDEHFRFGITSPSQPKQLGSDSAASILINAVAGIRYLTGITRGDKQLQEAALELLRSLPPEMNSIIRGSGLTPRNALESQGILEMLEVHSSQG